jgi:glycosyltransferase involved in cell wall biosynthesis
MNPRITVGLVVKNCENYIAETIKSILNQDLPQKQLEIIVVDGHSTDKTLSIIKRELTGCQIQTRIFLENEGLGAARQIVVDNARGEYIVWVDGDITMSMDFFRKLLGFLQQNARFGMARALQ